MRLFFFFLLLFEVALVVVSGVLISVQETSVVQGGTIHVTFFRLQEEDLDGGDFTLLFQDANGHIAASLAKSFGPGVQTLVAPIQVLLSPGSYTLIPDPPSDVTSFQNFQSSALLLVETSTLSLTTSTPIFPPTTIPLSSTTFTTSTTSSTFSSTSGQGITSLPGPSSTTDSQPASATTSGSGSASISPAPIPSAGVIGGVIAGVVAFLVVLVLFVTYQIIRRRRRIRRWALTQEGGGMGVGGGVGGGLALGASGLASTYTSSESRERLTPSPDTAMGRRLTFKSGSVPSVPSFVVANTPVPAATQMSSTATSAASGSALVAGVGAAARPGTDVASAGAGDRYTVLPRRPRSSSLGPPSPRSAERRNSSKSASSRRMKRETVLDISPAAIAAAAEAEARAEAARASEVPPVPPLPNGVPLLSMPDPMYLRSKALPPRPISTFSTVSQGVPVLIPTPVPVTPFAPFTRTSASTTSTVPTPASAPPPSTATDSVSRTSSIQTLSEFPKPYSPPTQPRPPSARFPIPPAPTSPPPPPAPPKPKRLSRRFSSGSAKSTKYQPMIAPISLPPTPVTPKTANFKPILLPGEVTSELSTGLDSGPRSPPPAEPIPPVPPIPDVLLSPTQRTPRQETSARLGDPDSDLRPEDDVYFANIPDGGDRLRALEEAFQVSMERFKMLSEEAGRLANSNSGAGGCAAARTSNTSTLRSPLTAALEARERRLAAMAESVSSARMRNQDQSRESSANPNGDPYSNGNGYPRRSILRRPLPDRPGETVLSPLEGPKQGQETVSLRTPVRISRALPTPTPTSTQAPSLPVPIPLASAKADALTSPSSLSLSPQQLRPPPNPILSAPPPPRAQAQAQAQNRAPVTALNVQIGSSPNVRRNPNPSPSSRTRMAADVPRNVMSVYLDDPPSYTSEGHR